MDPRIDPAFDQAVARLATCPWGRATGQAIPPALANWCAPVASADEALALLSSDAWEAWSSDRGGELSTYLHRYYRQRFLDWNAIALRAKSALAHHEPAIRAGLNTAGLTAPVALDTVKWDVVAALTCAAFMDCKPPVERLRLLNIYEAGHLPVGYDSVTNKVLVF
jgi:hypothetical protein